MSHTLNVSHAACDHVAFSDSFYYMLEMLIHVCIRLCSAVLAHPFTAIGQIILILLVALLTVLACRFPAHLKGACKCTIDMGLLSCICTDAICNVRPYIKDPASLFGPPVCFPFEEDKDAPHLLLNELDFLIPSICSGLGFHPLASETYTNEGQQNEVTLAHMLTVVSVKLFITWRS